MDVRAALKGQYHGALKMLRGAIEACPAELWAVEGDSRSPWRVSYHTLFFTHLYLQQRMEDFRPWSKGRQEAENTWGEFPDMEPYSKEEVLEYWSLVDEMIDSQIDSLDLESPDTGFDWYKNMPKLDHVMMNIRHIQEHTGQLRDRLISIGRDPQPDWVGTA